MNSRLVERPVADALVNYHQGDEETVPWLYLKAESSDEAIQQLVTSLYTQSDVRRRYAYKYRDQGRNGRLVEFDPSEGTFWINEQHEIVIENYADPEARRLLEVLATAEALLEVYMREIGISQPLIEHVLNKRDELLRSLATDEVYALASLARTLRDTAAGSANELEVAAVAALRALGFATRHISGSGEPDGLANFAAYSATGKSFTIETKSSGDVPDLNTIDFAGLRQHFLDTGADGCILVAPAYPGETKGSNSQVAKRAAEQKVSCWTVEQLARTVELAEARHINANDIQDIVLSAYTPGQVEAGIETLLTEPNWNRKELYQAILQTLAELEGVLRRKASEISECSQGRLRSRDLRRSRRRIFAMRLSSSRRQVRGCST